MFILDATNRYQTEWVGISDNDFIKVGFGKNKEHLREIKETLESLDLIEYTKGSTGRKSQYRIKENLEEKLMKLAEFYIEDGKVVFDATCNETSIKFYGEDVIDNHVVETPKKEVEKDVEPIECGEINYTSEPEIIQTPQIPISAPSDTEEKMEYYVNKLSEVLANDGRKAFSEARWEFLDSDSGLTYSQSNEVIKRVIDRAKSIA